jgi:membrane-bound lytic murein transglycosylase D
LKYHISIFFLLLLPSLLFGTLGLENNLNKQIMLLGAFDIEPNYLHDEKLNDMILAKKEPEAYKHYYDSMQNARLFIPTIKKILYSSDVPPEFIYLAMAESYFTTKALSYKKAAGIWQFMPATGRQYGLQIDDYVDERRDPIKSTEAAARYLKSLHDRFGKWYLAAMAYNCGEGCVLNAIRKTGGRDDLFTLLDERKKYLPGETRAYIRKIIAFGLMGIDENDMISTDYGYLMNRACLNSIATITLPKGEKISRVAEMLDIDANDMRKLNRHLTYDFVPPFSERSNVYIPYSKLNRFNQNYKPSDLKKIYLVHTVKAGENLSAIGSKYRVPYSVIKAFNNLVSNNLRVRQKLIIPTTPALPDKHEFTFAKNSYTVRRGDTLVELAKRFKISVNELKSMNNKKGNMLRVSEKLIVPALPASRDAYVVKSGDNLNTIAMRYKLTVKSLKDINNKESDVIRIGEKLRVY